jgi:hypothetical protein
LNEHWLLGLIFSYFHHLSKADDFHLLQMNTTAEHRPSGRRYLSKNDEFHPRWLIPGNLYEMSRIFSAIFRFYWLICEINKFEYKNAEKQKKYDFNSSITDEFCLPNPSAVEDFPKWIFSGVPLFFRSLDLRNFKAFKCSLNRFDIFNSFFKFLDLFWPKRYRGLKTVETCKGLSKLLC